jgi:hypothetical protein
MASFIRLLALATLVVGSASFASADSLTTLFSGTSSTQAGSGALFELTVTNPAGIQVVALDVNLEHQGTLALVKVYVTPDTYLGKETNAQAWTLVSQGSEIGDLPNLPTRVDVADFSLPPGNYGLAVYVDQVPLYTTTGNGANQSFANADLSLRAGATTSQLFGGQVFAPRVFNGTIYYDSTPPAWAVHCTGWPTSPNKRIEVTGTPSAAAASGFTVLSSVMFDGSANAGVLMYGVNGRAALPFGGGTLCIQPPIRRSPVVTRSVVTHGFQLDWNAFASGALGGSPHPALSTPGTVVNCQWWARRSNPAPDDFMLSSALEYTVEP